MGELNIGGVPVSELKERYGTPLYIFDEAMIRGRIGEFRESFVSEEFDTDVLYASKAFTCIQMIKIIKDEGLSLDVVSGGEIYTALKAGMDPAKLFFHGNNKTPEEIAFALDNGVGTFILDNIQEAKAVVEAMKGREQTLKVMLRINPGIDAHTHKYVVTANIDSKFGISAESKDEIAELVKIFDSTENISFEGIHAHIGSQIFDKNAFVAEIEKLCSFMKDMEQQYGIRCNALDLGGGFGARYTDDDAPIPVPEVCSTILETCSRCKKENSLSFSKVLIEPGRSIVAEAGYTLYTVGWTKETPHKKYAFIDGGMPDNIRPALYGAKYDADIANRMGEPKTEEYCIAGKCCESGDIIIEKTMLQHPEQGDLLVTYTTGAYGYAMSMRYNQIGRPAVVFVNKGTSRLAVKRETYEDMLRGEIE
ncbi:MAG: diaminopimelate decarboxylase [Lachnospiraceae bacterium]|nr:diaminopimelate decarboxylase [Lachnospiraceae bacterium]